MDTIEGSTGRKPYVITERNVTIPFHTWRAIERDQVLYNNCRTLEVLNPVLASIFRQVVRDYPELNIIRIRSGTKEDFPKFETGGIAYFSRPTTEHPYLDVILSKDLNRYTNPISKLKERAGLSLADVQRNPELLRIFTLLHEIGHAHHFLNHILTKYNGDFSLADKADQMRRDKEMGSLPWKGTLPSQIVQKRDEGTLESEFNKHRQYFAKKGIRSVDDLIEKQSQAYAALPSEQYADAFARRYLKIAYTMTS